MTAVLDPGSPTVLRTEAVDASPPGAASRGSKASKASKDRGVLGLGNVLLGLSVALAWTLLYLTVLSGFEQAHAQHRLYDRFRTELAATTAPTEAPVPAGDPVALLSIPKVEVDDLVVVEGTRPVQLQDAPGHLLNTVLPGQRGLASIVGRSLSFGAPFKRIGELRSGDPIRFTTAQGTFTYRVIGVRRDGDRVPPAVTADDGTAVLTLRSSDRGLLSAGNSVYVDAVLEGDPATAGTLAADDPDARLMEAGVDVTTLALLALALQLLVAGLAAFSWAWNRWSRQAAWIAVGPCVLGAAWLVSSIGTRLLPGLV